LEKSALKKKNLEDKVQIQKTKEKSKNNRYPLKPIGTRIGLSPQIVLNYDVISAVSWNVGALFSFLIFV
jgi:hypothetical protein